MAYGYNLEAEYESGYVHRENDQDHSPYVAGRNIFYDIVNALPVPIHGQMVRFSLVGKEQKYDIDWATLPDNARPIYYRDMARSLNMSTNEEIVECLQHYFGYQYTDEQGENHKEIKEIR